MDKVKIKRAKRTAKHSGAKEKVLAGLGVGATLIGGAGAVAAKPAQTQFVRTQTGEETSASGQIKQTLKRIFGAQEAKAAEETPPPPPPPPPPGGEEEPSPELPPPPPPPVLEEGSDNLPIPPATPPSPDSATTDEDSGEIPPPPPPPPPGPTGEEGDGSIIEGESDITEEEADVTEEGDINDISSQIDSLNERINDLAGELDSQSSQEDIQQINREIAELRAQINRLSQAVANLQTIRAFNAAGASGGLQMPPGYPASGAAAGGQQVQNAQTQGVYIVKKGDNLWNIARKYYGDGRQWRKILEANPHCLTIPGNVKTLRIGSRLVIP